MRRLYYSLQLFLLDIKIENTQQKLNYLQHKEMTTEVKLRKLKRKATIVGLDSSGYINE